MNKSLNDLAYTLIDMDTELSESAKTDIEQIEGVLNMRCL